MQDNNEIGVVFDCDGVLVNSEEVMFEAGYGFAREQGFAYTPREYAALTIGGRGMAEYLPVMARDFEVLHGRMMPRDFRYELMDRMETALRQKFAAIDGVRALLDTLKRHGVPCAVGTNAGAKHTVWRLETLGLSDYFNRHVYSFDHQTRPKPAPDIYLRAMAALPRRPEQCFIIDDSATGVRAGVAAGATVIGFTGGAHRESDYGADLRAVGAAHAAGHMDDVGRIIMDRLAARQPRPLP